MKKIYLVFTDEICVQQTGVNFLLIVPEDGDPSCFMFEHRIDSKNDFIHYFHHSIDAAFEVADEYYGIKREDWRSIII